MARHRAPDVASPLHGPHPTAGQPAGTGRPRHAAGRGSVVEAPERTRTGRHRAAPALEFIGPIVVVEPVPVPLYEPVEIPPLFETVPAPEPSAQPPAEPAPEHRQPYAETIAWAGFASLVSCTVVGAGQGEREQAIWTLGVAGAVLSTVGLGLLAAGRRRRGLPQ
ncbi:MAG: hypothetical protein ACT4QF_13240 [Sporichthyaceae bacterium]